MAEAAVSAPLHLDEPLHVTFSQHTYSGWDPDVWKRPTNRVAKQYRRLIRRVRRLRADFANAKRQRAFSRDARTPMRREAPVLFNPTQTIRYFIKEQEVLINDQATRTTHPAI